MFLAAILDPDHDPDHPNHPDHPSPTNKTDLTTQKTPKLTRTNLKRNIFSQGIFVLLQWLHIGDCTQCNWGIWQFSACMNFKFLLCNFWKLSPFYITILSNGDLLHCIKKWSMINDDLLHCEGGSWRHNSLFSKPGFIWESSRSSKSWSKTDDDNVDIVGEVLSPLLWQLSLLVLCCGANPNGYGYGDNES